MKRFVRIVGISLVLSLVIILTCSCGDLSKILPSSQYEDYDLTEQVLDYVNSNYIDGLETDEADLNAAVGIMSGLDAFSYITLADSGDVASSLAVGITFKITEYHEYFIQHINTDSPAYSAKNKDGIGLMRGDRVFSINEKRIEGLTSDAFQKVVKDLTELTLFVYRDFADEPFSFSIDITKDVIPTEECYYYNNLGGNIPDSFGYICLNQYTTIARTQFVNCITQFLADGNEYLLLDLRDNPGGDASVLISVLNYLITDEQNSSGIHFLDIDIRANGKTSTNAIKTGENLYIGKNGVKQIYVLVNENTASAAEATTGAIRAANTGVIIGCKTFGKGVAQSVDKVVRDKDDSEQGYTDYRLVLVTGKYYIVDDGEEGGRYCIHEVGITPDIITEYEFTPYLYDDGDILEAVAHSKSIE